MSSPTNIAARTWTLTAVLPDPQEQQAVETALTESHDDWAQAQQVLNSTLPPASMARLTLANALAEWSGDHMPLIRALGEPGVPNPWPPMAPVKRRGRADDHGGLTR